MLNTCLSPKTASRKIAVSELPPFNPQLRYSVREGSAYLRQSPAKTWNDIKHGLITPIRDAGRVYIPGSEIVRRSTLPQAA